MKTVFVMPLTYFPGLCYQGYKKSNDGGCDECPLNTYISHGYILGTITECTPCPDGKVSPPGSSLPEDCQEKGMKRNFILLLDHSRSNLKSDTWYAIFTHKMFVSQPSI